MAYANDMPQRITLIAPSDATKLAANAAGLRVANKGATWDTVAVVNAFASVGGGSITTIVSFDIAPNSVDYIPGIFGYVRATGTNTSGNLVIHSMHDTIVA